LRAPVAHRDAEPLAEEALEVVRVVKPGLLPDADDGKTGFSQQSLHLVQTPVCNLLQDGLAADLPEPEVEETAGNAEMRGDVGGAKAPAGRRRNVVQGPVDQHFRRRDGGGRAALEEPGAADAHGFARWLAPLQQAREHFRAAIAEFVEGELEARELFFRAGADERIVVAADDGYLLRHLQAEPVADRQDVAREEIVGAEDGGWLGQGRDPFRETVIVDGAGESIGCRIGVLRIDVERHVLRLGVAKAPLALVRPREMRVAVDEAVGREAAERVEVAGGVLPDRDAVQQDCAAVGATGVEGDEMVFGNDHLDVRGQEMPGQSLVFVGDREEDPVGVPGHPLQRAVRDIRAGVDQVDFPLRMGVEIVEDAGHHLASVVSVGRYRYDDFGRCRSHTQEVYHKSFRHW